MKPGLGGSLFPFLIAILLVSAGACKKADQEIKVYRVAKAPLDAPAESDPGAPPDAMALGSLTGNVPSTWESQPLSQMRQASFLVHGENGAVADISFVTLGPAAGNILDNVNRWLSQLAQPPLTQETLATAVQQLSTASGKLALVDLAGEPEGGDIKKDGRIIAAIASDERSTAFYKMRGNPELVGKEKENFLNWIRTSRSTNASEPAGNTTQPPPEPEAPNIKWEVPAHWSPGPPSAMRYASFVSGETEKADISVITFPGEGGGDLDNVNRWRQQIGLPPLEASGLDAIVSPLAAAEIKFSTVDLDGATSRTIAAWTRQEGRVWFFKLTGPKQAVERERPNFVKFVQSVRF